MSRNSKIGILLMIITGASKVAALLLTLVFSRVFGANLLTDAYYAAGTVPNLINNSLTVSSLTLFIPIYTECFTKEGKYGADKFSSSVLNSYAVFNFFLTIFVILASPVLANIVAPGFGSEGLTHTRNLICLLSLSFPITISAQVLINVDNANSHHLTQAALTLLNHILTIVLLITISSKYGIYSYPYVCIAAWIVQLVLQYISSRRYFKHYIRSFVKNKYLKTMLKLSIPVIIATSAEQINLAVDNVISSTLPTGSISYLGYSHKIYVAVLGLFTAVMMTIYYPIISRDYSSGNKDRMYSDIKQYANALTLIVMPVAVLLILSSDLIAKVLYGGGSISDDGLKTVGILFAIYCAGLVFAAIKDFTTRLFYVKHVTKTPMIINVFCVAFNIVLSITLKNYIGIYGVALATTLATLLCAAVECCVLINQAGGWIILKARKVFDAKNHGQVIISNAISGILCFAIMCLLPECNSFIRLIIIGFAFILIYFICLVVLRNDLVISQLKSVKRKK